MNICCMFMYLSVPFSLFVLTMMFSFFYQLSKELGFPVVANTQLTFTKCLDMKLQNHMDVVVKVAEIAGKEFSIEQVLAACLFSLYQILSIHLNFTVL